MTAQTLGILSLETTGKALVRHEGKEGKEGKGNSEEGEMYPINVHGRTAKQQCVKEFLPARSANQSGKD